MDILLYIAVLPVVVLCLYIYNKDLDKEPKKIVGKLFLWGMLSVIPIVILELLVDKIVTTDDSSNLVKLFIATLVGVALIEEGFKWLITHKNIYDNEEFNHPYDAIVYAVFASLGFALVENVLYVYGNGVSVGILRAFLTVPSHACDAVIMGYYLGRAKQAEYNNNQKYSNKDLALSLIMPILAHTLYDYFLFSQRNIMLVFFIIFVIALYIVCFKLIKKLSKISYNFDGTDAKHKKEKGEGTKLIKVNSYESKWYAISRTFGVIAIIVLIALAINYLIY